VEVLIGIALVLGLYWLYSANKTNQAAARYQLHKDSLEEASRLVGSRRIPPGDLGGYSFDLRGTPAELRYFLESDLYELVRHLHETRMPTDLGDVPKLTDLLEVIRRVQAWMKDDFPPDARAEMRQMEFDRAFGKLRELLSQFMPDSMYAARQVEEIVRATADAEAAMAWPNAGKRIGTADAEVLIHRARSIVGHAGPV